MNEQAPTEDIIREKVLRFLHQSYVTSRSTEKQAKKISEIKEWRKAEGYTQQQIVRTVTFLKGAGWITEEASEREINTPRGKMKTRQVRYRISNIGIIHFEGPSKFESESKFKGININNNGGIAVVGSGNLVNMQFKGLYERLDEISQLVQSDSSIQDKTKIEIISDIKTFQDQLVKDQPNTNVLKSVYESIKKNLGEYSKYATYISGIAEIISKMLH